MPIKWAKKIIQEEWKRAKDDFDYTRASKILTIATIILILSCVANILLLQGFFLLSMVAAFFSVLATYAACTDMDLAVWERWGSYTVTVRRRYLGETSAASSFALVAFGIIAIDALIWILVMFSPGSDLRLLLLFALSSAGGVLVALGGFLAHQEWNE